MPDRRRAISGGDEEHVAGRQTMAAGSDMDLAHCAIPRLHLPDQAAAIGRTGGAALDVQPTAGKPGAVGRALAGQVVPDHDLQPLFPAQKQVAPLGNGAQGLARAWWSGAAATGGNQGRHQYEEEC